MLHKLSENALHKAFADNKVNKINDRKEFFKVDLKEIKKVVKNNHNEIVSAKISGSRRIQEIRSNRKTNFRSSFIKKFLRRY